MNFDEIIDRRGTDCAKWDNMEAIFGVSPDSGIAMWVADMDFRAPEVVCRKLREMVESWCLRLPFRPRCLPRCDLLVDEDTPWMGSGPRQHPRDGGPGERHRALHRHVHRARRRNRADDTRLPRLSQGDPRFEPYSGPDAAGDRRGPIRARYRGMGRRDDRAGTDDDPVLAPQSRRPGLDARGAAANRRFRCPARPSADQRRDSPRPRLSGFRAYPDGRRLP